MSIEIRGLSKSFGTQKVLNALNLEIPTPGITCLMGPSGIGKTTLLRILLGLEQPEAGEIKGLEQEKIRAVFQEDRLCPEQDAVTNVRMTAAGGVTEEMIREHFKQVGLSEYEGKPASQLSGGMSRRVAVVRACLSDYSFLVMDEPLKGLDEETKDLVIAYIRKETEGRTVLLVTHQETEAEQFGGKILWIQEEET